MGPLRCRCVICGQCVLKLDSVSWPSEFRAICEDSSGVRITGVGRRDDNEYERWFAPFNPAFGWNLDEDIRDDEAFEPWRDFFLHDACWSLVQIYMGERFSLRRLFEILKSTPGLLFEGGLSWDHAYGGILVYDHDAHYPFEDGIAYAACSIQLLSTENPCEKLDVEALVPHTLADRRCGILASSNEQAYFSRLPMEIIETVASLLSTRDALNLRRVSKKFTSLLYSQYFWASRFRTWGERDFVFEGRRVRGIDWLGLYRLTKDELLSPALQARKRIWTLITSLAQLLNLTLVNDLSQQYLNPMDHRWHEVRADINSRSASSVHFTKGCQVLGEHIVHVPRKLSAVAFSQVNVGQVSFLTGLSLQDTAGGTIDLGYLGGSQKVVRGVESLKGFILAVGPRGIHAVRVVGGGEGLSDWIGDPGDSPRTERLTLADAIDAMKVGFDGYKLVSISVGISRSRISTEEPLSIRKAALWFPTIPAPNLLLNETKFTGESPLRTSYQPLCWIHFGGPQGQYLTDIIGMSYLYSGSCIHSLRFHYGSSSKVSDNRLGRCDPAQDPKPAFWDIDGVGGEAIEAVEAGMRSYEDPNAYQFLLHGTLAYVKLTTNRQRTITVGDPAQATAKSTFLPEPGTTITGFYASKHQEFGLISLGPISEYGRRANL